MKTKHLPLLIIALMPLVARAQTDSAGTTVALDPLVVTANRNEIPVSDVPPRVTIIDLQDIERIGALTVPDTLKKDASVDLIQYPAGGGLSGVGIRGFRPEFSGTNQHTLVLLDGRPAGVTSIGNLSLDNISRIEVLKGPASSLYGSSAMGGVINFITKQSSGPIQGDVSAKVGSFDTYDLKASAGGNITKRVDADFAVRHVEAGDYDIADLGEWARTSYKTTSGMLRVGSTLASGWRIDAKGDGFFGRDLGSPGAYSDGNLSKSHKDLDHYGADVRLRGHVQNHSLLAAVFGSREYQKTFMEPPTTPAYRSAIRDTSFHGAQLQDAWALTGPLTLTYGFDYLLVKNDSNAYTTSGARTTASPGDTQETFGYFAEAGLKLLDDRLVINAGARYDKITETVRPNAFSPTNLPGNRDFGTTDPRAGVVFKPARDWRIHGTIGRAFVSPSALQIAGFTQEMGGGQLRVTRGNPNLNAENAISWDTGIGWNRSFVSLDLTYFHTNVHDRISSVITTNTATYRETTYINSTIALQTGLEGEAAIDLGQMAGGPAHVWRLTESFTEMFDRTETPPTGPQVIRNVARFKTVAALNYDQPKWFARAGVRYVRGMNDQDNSRGLIFTGGKGGVFEYPSFIVCDVSAGYKFTGHHELSVQVDNVFNRYYYEKNDYPMPGRAIYGRYRFTF